jgi:hypothetical protein
MTPHEQEVADVRNRIEAAADGRIEMAVYTSREELHADLLDDSPPTTAT